MIAIASASGPMTTSIQSTSHLSPPPNWPYFHVSRKHCLLNSDPTHSQPNRIYTLTWQRPLPRLPPPKKKKTLHLLLHEVAQAERYCTSSTHLYKADIAKSAKHGS